MKQPMLLELKNISKSFDQRTILKNISFSADKGDTIAITGPSGSGKTSLLNIIGTMDFPDAGSVIFDGQALSTLTEKELSMFRNKHIGFIFQMHYLLPQCTLLENTLVPTLANPDTEERTVRDKAIRLLERVGLKNQMFQKPGELSGGECQRAAFVRALINGHELILADEPTGSLDQESAEVLSNLLIELNKENNTTLIVVTHSSELAGKMKTKYKILNAELLNIS
jgi:lipoprotein-releasing system ATP-binding protein